ncbi:MAG: hypothetical protein U0802_10090 [Candidatus Binatia bacterium]
MPRRHIALAALAAALLSAGMARAQLSGAEQSCIDNYNNKLRLVSQQAGKSATDCIKSGAADAGFVAETCVVSNPDGKIAAKEAKVSELFNAGAKCDPVPPVIVRSPLIANASHRSAITLMMHKLFGNPIGPLNGGPPEAQKMNAKCLGTAVQRATQAYLEIIKQQRACKKTGLKSGAISSNATLASTCGTLTQIDPAGKAAGKLTKLDGDVLKACGEPGIDLTALFDGLAPACHGTAAALSGCLQAVVRCRACYALLNADGAVLMNCDLFDDGATNSSCLAGM